jgi:serralysin
VGNNGNDILSAGAGNDRLYGHLGKDTMTGGLGADVFFFSPRFFSASEVGNGATRDVIRDFTHLVDDINLSGIDAKDSTFVNEALTFIGTAAFTGVQGQLRYFQINAAGTVNDRTIIAGDTNGNKVADFQIELVGLKVLTAADFIL